MPIILVATMTSDARLLACRELDDVLKSAGAADKCFKDSRTGNNIRYKFISLLRQSIYSRLAGYDDTNHIDRLAQDPAMKVAVDLKGFEKKGDSTSEMGRFETEWLAQKDNLKCLEGLNVEWEKRVVAGKVHSRIVLDMDRTESPALGRQK